VRLVLPEQALAMRAVAEVHDTCGAIGCICWMVNHPYNLLLDCFPVRMMAVYGQAVRSCRPCNLLV
jgi:hypothetical protein